MQPETTAMAEHDSPQLTFLHSTWDPGQMTTLSPSYPDFKMERGGKRVLQAVYSPAGYSPPAVPKRDWVSKVTTIPPLS